MGLHRCCTHDTIMMHGAECGGRLIKRMDKHQHLTTRFERLPFYPLFFIPIHRKLHNSSRTAKSDDKHIWSKQLCKFARIMPAEKIFTCVRVQSDQTEFGCCTGRTEQCKSTTGNRHSNRSELVRECNITRNCVCSYFSDTATSSDTFG